MEFQDLESKLYEDIENEILYSAIEETIENEDKAKPAKTLNSSKKKKRKRYSSKLKTGLKIRTVILLLLTLLVNTYAWFIYISTVSMGISMHVKNWSFELSSGDQTENFIFEVGEIYPGMTEKEQIISAKNSGETEAELSCDILSLKIFEDKYVAGETTYDNNGTEEVYTSEKLFELLGTYPFKIQIYIDDVLYTGTPIAMPAKSQDVVLKFKVNWDYEVESDDQAVIDAADEIDTYWGNRAYEFDNNHPDEYCIEVEVKIKAVQKEETQTTTP